MDFDTLFLQRTAAVHLAIETRPGPERSRVGGNVPAHFQADEHAAFLDGHRYLMTLSDAFARWNDGLDVSIFLRVGFAVYEPDTRYPDIGITCVRHPSTPPGDTDAGRIDAIRHGRLVELPAGSDLAARPPFVTIGGTPAWVQDEPDDERSLLADGYSFVLQVDENGYPDGFLVGDYLLSYGALYVYGSWTKPGRFDRIVAGFTQFS